MERFCAFQAHGFKSVRWGQRGHTYWAGVQEDQFGESNIQLQSKTLVLEHVIHLRE